MEIENINIKKYIVHILDKNSDIPILSDDEHPISEEINDFIEKHIIKIFKDKGLKNAYFRDNSEMKNDCNILKKDINAFTDISIKIGEKLFNIIRNFDDIPSCDLVCVVFNANNENFLGILKFNYKPSFVHYVKADETKKVNTIIKQLTTLPNESQKINECALINLNDKTLKVLERKYDIDGEKKFYLSDIFLDCHCETSDKDKIKSFNKANKTFNKKYFDEEFKNSADIKIAVKDSIEKEGTINIEKVCDDAFKENPEMKKIYKDHLKESGIKEKNIEINNTEYGEKVYNKQKIKTDNGIEIKLPRDFYKDKGKLEFVNNPDGTVSIIIKNIGKLIDK
ncbi:MAG: nucleoid-associated protein [Firmicutes bacterium]|nr:nucleoid-associated protein [Bacillota bacterium]